MRRFREKYFGDADFYKMVFAVAIPIMIQNGITNFVNMLDNIMIGQVGTEQMSGVAIVNQLIFVYNLCIFGGVSGAGIFTAQYFGQGNHEGVRQTMRFKLWMVTIITAMTAVLFLVFWHKPDQCLSERGGFCGKYCGDINSWGEVSEDHADRPAGLCGGTDLLEHTARVRSDDTAHESGDSSC